MDTRHAHSGRGRPYPGATAWSLLAALAACASPTDLRKTDGHFSQVEVTVSDFDGTERPRHDSARKPLLTLHLAGAPVLDDDVLGLWPGEATPGLIDDLARAPMLAATARARVPLMLRVTPSGLQATPTRSLIAGARYTLAASAWLAMADGQPLLQGPWFAELAVSSAPDAGASVIASLPADGASTVAPNLAAAWIVLDGRARDLPESAWLIDPAGLAVPTFVTERPCAELLDDPRAVQCLALTPSGVLGASGEHALEVGDPARDGRGAPVGPFIARFRTAARIDARPPRVLPLTCALDEVAVAGGCALIDDAAIALRLLVDEPVRARFRLGDIVGRPLSRGGLLQFVVRELAPDTPLALELELRDLADNRLVLDVATRTTEALAQVSIVEVRADPIGREPQQEFVELLNYGAVPVQLQGFSLSDAPDVEGDLFEQPFELSPGARVLLVAEGFDPNDPRDVSPPPGAALLRVGASLGRSGMSNAGEPAILRDALGRRISAAPPTPAGPGACLRRLPDHDMRDGSPAAFGADPDEPCTPGT